MIGAIARKLGPRETPPLQGRWSPLWPMLAFLLFVALSWLAGRVSSTPGKEIPFFTKLALSQAASWLTAVFILAIASRYGGVTSLGIKTPGLLDPLWAGLSYLAFIPVYFLAALLWTRALHAMGFDASSQEVLRELPGLHGRELLFALAVVVLLGPLFEELLFRAFLQSSLQRRLGERLGWILAAGVFAVVHEPIAIFPVFCLGLFFGYLYRRSGRIWVSWMAHALHNGLVAALWIGLPELRKALGD